MRTLKPEHAEYVAHYWTYHDNWANRVIFLKVCIQNFPSAAAFANNNDEQPVAWACTYYFEELGMLYTLESHRRKGLAIAVMATLCQSYQKYSDGIPFATYGENASSAAIFERLGFENDEVLYYMEAF